MTFTISIFLIPYAIFFLIWLIMSIVAIYHMLKFGFKSFATFFATFLFVIIASVIIGVSYHYINQIDWNLQISIFDKDFEKEIIF